MVRHVILWKFKDDCKEEGREFIRRLKALEGEIPEILRMEVAENTGAADNYDACLISDFADFDALERYRVHPKHQAVSQFCQSIRVSRTCVDFEV